MPTTARQPGAGVVVWLAAGRGVGARCRSLTAPGRQARAPDRQSGPPRSTSPAPRRGRTCPTSLCLVEVGDVGIGPVHCRSETSERTGSISRCSTAADHSQTLRRIALEDELRLPVNGLGVDGRLGQ